MGIIDGHNQFNFGNPTAISSSNAATPSANVFDYGSAVLLYGGDNWGVELFWKIILSAGTTPTVRAQYVGADAAALNSNVLVLADSGVVAYKADGTTALANTDTVWGDLKIGQQWAPKRYYGMLFTLGGTTPSANCYGWAMVDAPSNMMALKAAVP